MNPKKCPVCNLGKFRETNKKIICESCGYSVWKNPIKQKEKEIKYFKRKKPLPIKELKEEYGR